MAGKNPHEAVANFLHPIQAALACFTPAVLVHHRGYHVGRQNVLLVSDDQPINLRGAPGLDLHFSHRYEIVRTDDPDRGPWKVKSLGYMYKLEDAASAKELLSYHWHPEGKWKLPHLHVNAFLPDPNRHLKDAHLPTQRISVEDVLELAVGLGAEPLTGRAHDWETTLAATRDRFMRYKTW